MIGTDCAEVGAVRQMARLLRHRGPDDEGMVAIHGDISVPLAGPDTAPAARAGGLPFLPTRDVFERERVDVVLANRRLAIVDLSPAGHQPLCAAGGTVWVTHNGEIYNHVELRRELEALGHSFAGHSDTEVVAAAYAEWGAGCFERFNGMWGTAIWDARRRTLVLARDRFGVKPLYYACGSGSLAFASEIKALLGAGLAEAVPNAEALRIFLRTGRIDVLPGETCFSTIRQLEPGTFLEVGLDGRSRDTRFYDLEPRAPQGDAAEELGELLDDAVRLRLRSDVPVGGCLSGGLDSSAITAIAAHALAGCFKTFTYAAGDGAHDETVHAERVVRATGAEANVVSIVENDLPGLLLSIAAEQDEPIGSGSVVAQRQLMACAHERGMKVLLDGQGGDEVLAGYTYYAAARLAGLVRHLRLVSWAREFDVTRKNMVQDGGWLLRATLGELRRGPDRLRRSQLGDVHEHLPALLHYEDRNSMTFSIETRLPFLDYRLVELGLGMADAEKIDRGWTKLALRRAMSELLPAETVWRRDKVQFAAPDREWLDGPLRELAADLFAVERERLSELAPGPGGEWRRLALELWFRSHVDSGAEARSVELAGLS